ncbi:hypothetical protein JTB14_034201 [Gonioctena quinquepunctata]|nr:hypothetical protein JTB14_034201 [Gonioctena quinquepunctata]
MNQLLKNLDIISEKNINIRDGVKMLMPSMEKYDKCVNVLQQHEVTFHTLKKFEGKEVRAIFEGVAEDIPPEEINKEFVEKGYNSRVVATSKNGQGCPIPIILVIVPGSEHRIKMETTICDMEVRFEYHKKKKRIGRYNNFSTIEKEEIPKPPRPPRP